MSSNPVTPEAPAAASPVQQDVAGSCGPQPAEDTLVQHDTTLKWIVDDAAAAEISTPPGVGTPPRPCEQPPAATQSQVAEATVGKPPVAEDAPPSRAPPVPFPEPPLPVAEASAGATPADFLTPDSTSPARVEPNSAEAAPGPVIAESGGSEGNLPEIAVEESSSAEPHEVDMEVLDEADSAQSLVVQTASQDPGIKPTATPPPSPATRRTVTPPPVPAEAAVHTRPPPPPGSPAPAAPAAPAAKPPATARPSTEALAAAWFEGQAASFVEAEPVPEALARRPLQKRSKPWYEEVFDEDFLRTLPFMTEEQTAREVRFIREALSPPAGGEILDIACGYGRHALELAHQGLRVTGLDLSLPMLIRAADHAQKRGLSVNFVHADMREMSYSGQFDAAYCVLSSFGYFDEETNLRVASCICKALKPGGRFLIDIINRDYIVRDLPSRVWWEGDGCVVLEEVDFNYHTSRVLIRRSVAFGNGRQVEQDLSLRAYSLHELGKLLRQAGLRVLDVSGGLATKSRFFGSASRNIIAVCERPAS